MFKCLCGNVSRTDLSRILSAVALILDIDLAHCEAIF